MGVDAMNDSENAGIGGIRIANAVKSKLFLIAAIVMIAAASLAFGRIGEGVMQMCMFAFAGAVAAELFVLRSYAEKGNYLRLRNDAAGLLVIEAVLCFLTACALLYSASLVFATFFPVSNFLKASSGMASLVARATNAVSLAAAGAVPKTIAPKVTLLIRSFAEVYGVEKTETLLNIAVWTTVGCLFVGMLVRIASGLFLLCSASGLRKAFDGAEGKDDLSKPAKYLIAAGAGIALCSGIPAGGVVLILAGRALRLSSYDCRHRGPEECSADEIKN